jgi:hypothetical protein
MKPINITLSGNDKVADDFILGRQFSSLGNMAGDLRLFSLNQNLQDF